MKPTRVRKITRGAAPLKPIHPTLRQGRIDSEPVVDLREALFDMSTQEMSDLSSIDEVGVRVASLWPAATFQAVVKFRNRGLPWATFVAHDPVAALEAAVQIAVSGPKAVETQSTALYHQKREAAQEVKERILEEHKGLVKMAQLELESRAGWVVVVFVEPGLPHSEIEHFAGVCEVRELENINEPPRKRQGVVPRGPDVKNSLSLLDPIPEPRAEETPARKRKGGGSSSAKSAASKPTSAKPAAPVEGDMRTWKKSALIKYHQEQFGKQPNNKLSVDEIVDLIEVKLAAREEGKSNA